MKNWLKKCSVALLVFSMIGTTMPVYAADAPAAKTQTTTEDQTEEQKSEVQAEEPQVEYIEKPKALSFAVYEGKLVSCIPPVQREPLSLTGQGILVGIIDSGIDIYHPDFRKEDGTTRIVGIWDQTAVNEGKMELMPPSGYSFGLFYSEEKINELLQAVGPAPAVDASGHGTHVAGIAAGNGRASRGENRGVAYESQLLIVKLGGRTQRDFPQTAELMQAIDFCIRLAAERNQPLALNLSYGNNYGSHTGTSLLETYLDEAALVGRTTICIGSGNEGNLRRHASGQLERKLWSLASLPMKQVCPFNCGSSMWIPYKLH